MKINEEGLRLIKKYEGYRAKPYKLAGERFYTVGFGHYGADVEPDRLYTYQECIELLKKDIERFEKHVNDVNTRYNYNFNINEFSALVSFAYNVGNIEGLTMKGQRTKEVIADSFTRYSKDSRGVTLAGLFRRRVDEAKLFKTPCEFKTYEEVDNKPHIF